MCSCINNCYKQVKTGYYYWGYLHQEGNVHVKRWMHPQFGSPCDKCHAIMQQREGNDFIVRVFDIIEADNYTTAHDYFCGLLSKKTTNQSTRLKALLE